MTKLSNIVVGCRLKETGNGSSQVLPVARSKVEIGTNGNLSVTSNDGGVISYKIDGCVEGEDKDEILLAKLEMSKTLKCLLHGVSVSVIGIGGEGEKAGEFAKIMRNILTMLETQLQTQDLDINLSYGIFGVSDTSCIDLLTYARKDVGEMENLKTWNPLTTASTVNDIIDSLDQGYSLPCITIIRLLVKSNVDESLPTAMSTLLLADLGGGPQLERSFAQLRSLIANCVEVEPFSESALLIEPQNYLLSLIEESFGGSGLTFVVADVPVNGVTRSVNNHLGLLTALRRIKNRPVANLETPEMIELATLVETHNRLEVEHRSVCRELKVLQKALKVAETQHEGLIAERDLLGVGSETQRWEFEYEISRLAMEKITVHERIRTCEIDLVCMEHERLVLLAEMDMKQQVLAEMEERLRKSLEEKETLKKHYKEEISTLSDRLTDAQRKLETTGDEKGKLEQNLKSASEKISELQEKIKVTQSKLDLKNLEKLKEHSDELKKFKADLATAKEVEAQLNGKLSKIEKDNLLHQSSVKQLEGKISELCLENATLLAKIEVLSQKPQSPTIKRTMMEIEEKWASERTAIKTVVDELKQMINENAIKATIADHPRNESIQNRESSINYPLPATSTNKAAAIANVILKKNHQSASKSKNVSIRNIVDDNTKKSISETFISTKEKALPTVKEVKGKNIKSRGEKNPPLTLPIAVPLLVQPVSDSTTSINAINVDIQTQPVKKTAIKLQPKSKSKDKASVANDKPALEKILVAALDDADIEIPGTPPKKNASSIPTTAISPAKVWKPSAFIPGIVRKPPAINENSGLFANFNFSAGNGTGVGGAAGEEGARKRIKLPEKMGTAGAALTTSIGATTMGRNVDPAVYSTIMGSFDIPNNLKK